MSVINKTILFGKKLILYIFAAILFIILIGRTLNAYIFNVAPNVSLGYLLIFVAVGSGYIVREKLPEKILKPKIKNIVYGILLICGVIGLVLSSVENASYD